MHKLDYKKTIFIGMAFLGIASFWQLYDIIIPLILENSFKMSKTLTGIIMSLDNVLALFLLPIFGALSDKTNSKFGKRTPYIFIGTTISAIGMLIIPYANNTRMFLLFNIGLAIVLLGMSIYRSPAVALMPDLTPKSLRSKANAIINLMGAIGGILTLVSIKLLVPKNNNPDYTLLFLTIIIIMISSIIILKLKIDENSMKIIELENKKTSQKNKLPKDIKKSIIYLLASIFFWFTAYNAVTTAFSRYSKSMWGMHESDIASALMFAGVIAIFSFIPAGIISSKIGRKKTILMGILMVSTTYFLGILLKEFSIMIYISFAIMGIGWAFINVNSFPMIVEMAKSGDIGKYTGTYYTASMSAQILTPILSGYMIDKLGYNILFPYALIFSILSFLTMLQVNHGDEKFEIKSKLELFDTED